MKKIFLAMTIYSTACLAGQTGGGGGLGKQLQEMAISESLLSELEMRDVTGRSLVQQQSESFAMRRSVRGMMESAVDQPQGILIEVKASDFSLVAADAADCKDFIYRDVPVRVVELSTEKEIVTMSPIEDPSITIVVKALEGSSL